MGVQSWLFARLYDRMARASERAGVREWRAELLSRAEGRVLEIGAGTGLNLEHYGDRVQSLVLTEPEPQMTRRLRRHPLPRARTEVLEAPGDRLPVPDASQDVVVSTLVLCSVPDVAAVLGEVRRVLEPGGRLLFLEHVLSDDPRIQRRQRRLEPLWRWFACGCRITHDAKASLEAAGLKIEELRDEPMPKAPSFVARSLRGVAVSS